MLNYYVLSKKALFLGNSSEFKRLEKYTLNTQIKKKHAIYGLKGSPEKYRYRKIGSLFPSTSSKQTGI
jgi:hypothetical protein